MSRIIWDILRKLTLEMRARKVVFLAMEGGLYILGLPAGGYANEWRLGVPRDLYQEILRMYSKHSVLFLIAGPFQG